MNTTSHTEIVTINAASTAAKIVTATSGTVYSFTSWTLNDVAALLTCIFVLGNIGLLIPKYYRLYKAWRNGDAIKVEVQ